MKRWIAAVCFAAGLILSASAQEHPVISEYRVFIARCMYIKGNRESWALRKFKLNGSDRYLMVNPDTLESSVERCDLYRCTGEQIQFPSVQYKDKALTKAMNLADNNSRRLQNGGIVHLKCNGCMYLTVDLCPSPRKMDRTIFKFLINRPPHAPRPVPVAIAVSGLWMRAHRDDIHWLLAIEKIGEIAITWVNHSYTHPRWKEGPISKNFLLRKGINLDHEVLDNERMMLEMGLLPSVFFRFPGLVSGRDLLRKILAYGLIPLGSDAWLGKLQWPREGSIILVHATGKEPVGVKRFIHFFNSKMSKTPEKGPSLCGIREGLLKTLQGE